MRVHFLILGLLLAAACRDDNNPGADLAMPPLDGSLPDEWAPLPDFALAPCADVDGGAQAELRCTGLYSDWPSRAVDPANHAYGLAFPFWSDGAQKSRWLYLPPGTQIDVSNLDEWTFPVGTKVWKEFRLDVGGTVAPIETRLIEKIGATKWSRISYAWSADGATATALPLGRMDVPGTNHYEIPSVGECSRCHGGRIDGVLGIETVEMAAPGATGLSWDLLQTMGLLKSSNGNHTLPKTQLQVPGAPTESAAIGYLHANCGLSCHNPNLGLQLRMRLESNGTATQFGPVAATPIYTTAVNQLSSFQPVGADGGVLYRIRPTDSARSCVYYRPGLRDALTGGFQQMPPIDTHVVDTVGRATIDAWMNYMTVANGYPAPLP